MTRAGKARAAGMTAAAMAATTVTAVTIAVVMAVASYGGNSDRGWKREHGHANSNPSRKVMHCTNCEEAGEME
jgi:hypothetical protein